MLLWGRGIVVAAPCSGERVMNFSRVYPDSIKHHKKGNVCSWTRFGTPTRQTPVRSRPLCLAATYSS
ncbi:protein of unknown function [Blastococcus saxobsidens DD2]|uniref:Uncharacterized protein n=1 Tax=Blastococcus saxobsidens (strain DD2) TaxID=1146883 RepID=H6RTI4_BLASD|nr:protein of unknown function [Blastococcus saxobsidens DD2]